MSLFRWPSSGWMGGRDMETRIREATVEDARALSGVLIEVHAPHVAALPAVFQAIHADERTEGLLRDQIGREDGQAFVAEDDGDLVGYVWVRMHDAPALHLFTPRRYAEIDVLVVRASARRRGIGRALVERAHNWAAAQGCSSVQLVVYEFNKEGIRFFERLGYVATRRTMGRSLEPPHASS